MWRERRASYSSQSWDFHANRIVSSTMPSPISGTPSHRDSRTTASYLDSPYQGNFGDVREIPSMEVIVVVQLKFIKRPPMTILER